ncbi:DUF1543 domain-containing protein [Hufsiella ginkgonis]|uniref:DUF1543 domain-containing protein n=1 Tax=Hufsiella ginkgonis TaxID=2695274 RepID=A0A7K1Y355_9SPHI|nr:DUF1543 domain-containing protein [Hufsiella ginkgonis]MXV17734.1 DUF1543 domain-containing protein [Hufsiella ginkgonis]
MSDLKLFMVLLGSKAPQRNVEQHDYFFGIAARVEDLVPRMKAFWPEAGSSLHMDGWREVTAVNQFAVEVIAREASDTSPAHKLFFINLGGYQSGKLEEQHYTVLTVQQDRASAVQEAKKSVFFRQNSIKGANSHIDEKYGIDVDDIYRIEEILSPGEKEKFHLKITLAEGHTPDTIHLGYFKLDKLK